MIVKTIDSVPQEEVKAGTKTYRQVLISPEEAPNFAMRRFIIEPGGEMPAHTNTVEHEQLVLNGQAAVGIGDRTFEVTRNMVVFIPAGLPHWYKATGDEPFEFLCLVPNKDDTIELIGG
ncbi:cupin domain-containing protein [Candidatus Omnitrophota bacterium]